MFVKVIYDPDTSSIPYCIFTPPDVPVSPVVMVKPFKGAKDGAFLRLFMVTERVPPVLSLTVFKKKTVIF